MLSKLPVARLGLLFIALGLCTTAGGQQLAELQIIYMKVKTLPD